MREDGTLESGDVGSTAVLLHEIDWDKKQYAMVGEASDELITYAGFVLVHDDKAEMEYLFNKGIKKVIPLPPSIRQEQAMSIKNHPQINGIIRFPLRRKDFRR
jgi:hypothetical protein